MKICSRALKITHCKYYYSITTDAGEIRALFLTDDIVRIRVDFSGEFLEESYTLVTTAWEDRLDDFMEDERTRIQVADCQLKQFSDGSLKDFDIDSSEGWVLFGKKLALVIEANPFKMSLYNQDGQLLHRDVVDLSFRQDNLGRAIHTCEIFEGDGFYGFGEQTGALNKFQERIVLSPSDAMGYNPKKREALYKHIPFYIKLNENSGKSLGYFYHNTRDAQFDLGRSHSNYWKAQASYIADGGDIDLFLIAGEDVKSIVSSYTYLTGRPAMLPKKALGYLGSSMYYSELDSNCQEALHKFVMTAKCEGFPIDGFQLSSGYTSQETEKGLKRCVFTWNEDRFPNPEEYFKDMSDLGLVVSPNVKPGILLDHPNISEFIEEDMLVKASEDEVIRRNMVPEENGIPGLENYAIGTWWGGKGVFCDFTSPKARDAWKRMLKDNVLSCGTASVWNDNCEYDSLVDQDAKIDFDGKGGTISELRNVQSNLMCKITDQAIREMYPNTRPYIVCRAGHSGIQRYAQNWSGDNLTCWDSLKYNVATMLGMALSGVSNYGCDIGGFYGEAPEPELLLRWVQNGIFQPRFSIHSVNTDNTVTEPWMYPAYTDLIRQAVKLRYSLSAYYYSLMMEANQTGVPIMRPFMMEFPHDNSSYDEDREFMVGSSLLISNVLDAGERIHELRLPEGRVFYDFNSRAAYLGGCDYDIDVDLEDIPMFIPSGGILPLVENQLSNLDDDITDVRYIMAGDADGEFTMYEDDGHSLNYEKGDFLLTNIIMTQEDDRTYIDFKHKGKYESSVERAIIDIISNGTCPSYVKIEDKLIEQYLYKPDFDQCETGWYYDIEKNSSYIKYPNKTEDYRVLVSYSSLDMLGM